LPARVLNYIAAREGEMPNAYISGTGFYAPERVVKNDDLRTQYGVDTTHEWILQRTGIGPRRAPIAKWRSLVPFVRRRTYR
jgi:hypothetical protein